MIRMQDTSIVICAYTMKRWDDICEAIESLRKSHGGVPEIVLVIDHNEELLTRAQAAFPRVKVAPSHHERGLSGARNTGIDISKGSFIGFFDDDAVAEPEWIATSLTYFDDPSIVGVMPRVKPIWLSTLPRWFPREYNWTVGASHPDLGDVPSIVRNVFGGAMIVRREAFTKAGGFSSALGRTTSTLPISGEETEWCMRVRAHMPQANFMVDPNIAIGHKVPAGRLTWNYFFKRCLAEGISKGRIMRMAGGTKMLTSEKHYVLNTLVRAAKRDFLDTIVRHDIYGLARVAASVLGLSAATVGYLAAIVWPFGASGDPKGGTKTKAAVAPQSS